MKEALLIRPAAEAELEAAYYWYEERREGLGHDFLLCVEEAIDRILRTPELFPVVHKQVRRALIRRFPYGIFYLVDEEKILIRQLKGDLSLMSVILNKVKNLHLFQSEILRSPSSLRMTSYRWQCVRI